MINITDKSLCCGCSACLNICPQGCITMQSDSEGFQYPEVDTNICIECGLCEKVCPFLLPYDARKPENVYAANNKDTKMRLQSSSGGVFSILAEKVIREGGVVFGARFDENWQVVLDYAETLEGIAKFRGSKYVQGRIEKAFYDAQHFLKSGRFVLFSGTPCQIAGLNHFLRKEYDNLVTVDFVCHGVPSPKVWSRYLKTIVLWGGTTIKNIKFRDKPNGWKKFNLTFHFNGEEEHVISNCYSQDHYMKAFLSDMILRPSCYNCMAKSGRSNSDITIADFWGVNNILPQIDDDKGTSLLFLQTEKGRRALEFDSFLYVESTYNDAFRFNPAIEKSANPHKNRQEFFEKLDNAPDLVELINKELKYTFSQHTMFFCRRCFNKVKSILRKCIK